MYVVGRKFGVWLSTAASSRYLSTAEVSTALRPFYFSVHPDLFGQHPVERQVNENSLKLLNYHIESIIQRKPQKSTELIFYIRKVPHKTLQPVKINVPQPTIRETVRSILSACFLPTQHVDSLAQPVKVKTSLGYAMEVAERDWEDDFASQDGTIAREETLTAWLTRVRKDAEEATAAGQPVREEISRLQEQLCRQLSLRDIVWDCGWGMMHFRGCLQSFRNLVTHHPETMAILRDQTLIFGRETGVSLKGDVMLNIGEVRHNWLDFIRNLESHRAVQRKIPILEKSVSQNLCNIAVVQRQYRPTVLAASYEYHLRVLTTSLADYRGRQRFPTEWYDDLSRWQLIVEGEAGPLMLAPGGQFISPASCPIFLLVSFISQYLKEAEDRILADTEKQTREKALMKQCNRLLQLEALEKDESVSPEQMIECMGKLLEAKDILQPLLFNGRLKVTQYYSVLSDGELCVPWNWKN